MLRSQALAATFWSASDVVARQGLQFGISIALARLLTPEDYGTISLLCLFTGIASVFVDSGFSTALIQRQGVTHAEESTVFWFNLGMGALVTVALLVAAPAFAEFYALPVLVPLTVVLALNVLISALGSIQATLFTKQLDFRTPMRVNVIATFTSGAVAILLAWRGYGVWTLAAQTLVAGSLTTGLLWAFSAWRPALVFDVSAARKFFGFGGYLLASGLADTTYSRLYTLLIGKFYGVRELGLYSRADSTKGLPSGILTGILSRVAFPVFAASAADKDRLRRGVRMALRGMMLINIPAMFGMLVLARPLVMTLFGEAWLSAVPILQVLCLAGVFWPLHVINLNVLLAQGHSKLFFKLELLKKGLGVALLLAGARYGVMGIAWSQVVFGVLAFLINARYSGRFLGYGASAQTRDCIPMVAVSALMTATVFVAGRACQLNPFLSLSLLSALGAFTYLGLGWLVQLEALTEALDILKQRLTARDLPRTESAGRTA